MPSTDLVLAVWALLNRRRKPAALEPALRFKNCEGSIVLDGVHYREIIFENCPKVTVTNCIRV